jgi:hypothetical protein
MALAFVCSVAVFLAAPYALRAVVVACGKAPGRQRQLLELAAAAAAAPITLACACDAEFNRAMHAKTLTHFDATVKPQEADVGNLALEGAGGK